MATKKAPAAKKAPAKRGEQKTKLDALGIDTVCERIEAGESVGAIADALGIPKRTMWDWIDADSARSARVRASREKSAEAEDDKAEAVLAGLTAASTPAEVARARELASHYRWRASKRNPKTYGDKLDLNHSGKVDLTDDQVATRLDILLQKAAHNKQN